MSDEILSKALDDVKRYTSADEELTKAIIKHLGIAVRSNDASLVSCGQASELERVRESFLKKKLGMTGSDAELDQAIQDVCQQMKDDRRKLRITFYFLLVKKLKKESAFA